MLGIHAFSQCPFSIQMCSMHSRYSMLIIHAANRLQVVIHSMLLLFDVGTLYAVDAGDPKG